MKSFELWKDYSREYFIINLARFGGVPGKVFPCAAYSRINVINSLRPLYSEVPEIPRVQRQDRAELTDNAGTDGVPHGTLSVRPENDHINSGIIQPVINVTFGGDKSPEFANKAACSHVLLFSVLP